MQLDGVCEMMGFGMGFGLIGLFLMLIFLGGLVLVAVLLAKALFPNGTNNRASGLDRRGSESARDILATRYARGEITREQYETMKQDIG